MNKDTGEHCGRCGATPDNIIIIWHYDLCYHESHGKSYGIVPTPNRTVEHRYCMKCMGTTMIDSCNHKRGIKQ